MIEIEIDDTAMRARWGVLNERFANTKPLMAGIANIMDAGVQEEFRTQGGGTWAALSQTRKDIRTEAGTWPGKILIEHGKLMSSITPSSTNDEARVGTNDVRAKTLHYGAKQGAFGRSKRGTPLPWGNIPARKIFVIRDATRADITTAALDWFMGR